MDGGDVVDSDTRPPKILDNGDGDGEGPDQLLNKQNSSKMCSANVANNAEKDGEEEETEIGSGGGGVDFINVSRSGDGGGSCVVLDKSEQNISGLGRNSVVNGNNGFHDKYLNGSVDSGEHSDGAPAQINYAEPASVLSPDPRRQGNINRIIGGNPAFIPWILGGVDARMNGYPWMVQLKRPDGRCGGTVINSRLEFLNFYINTFGKLLLWLSFLYYVQCTKNTTILREKL